MSELDWIDLIMQRCKGNLAWILEVLSAEWCSASKISETKLSIIYCSMVSVFKVFAY